MKRYKMTYFCPKEFPENGIEIEEVIDKNGEWVRWEDVCRYINTVSNDLMFLVSSITGMGNRIDIIKRHTEEE